MAKKQKKPLPVPLLALLLAWLIPGAGHVYLGRRLRGIVIFVTIGITFWGGVVMGGVMTVDRQSEPWWFLADLFTGAHGLAGWQWQRMHIDRLNREVMANEGYQRQEAGLVEELRGRQADLREAENALRSAPNDRALKQRVRNRQARVMEQVQRLNGLREAMVQTRLAESDEALTAPMDTVARAYSGVAGLLNLMCIFDALLLAMMGVVGEAAPTPKGDEAT